MKKFTFKNVLDGFRSSVTQPVTNKTEHATIEETLRPEFFSVSKTIRHGFPYQPMSVAFDPIQKLLAVGTKHGSIRLIGRPGVDVHLQHETDAGVFQIEFLPNAGALVSVTQDDTLHLWNFRQKRPEVVHSLKFNRERITCIRLPFQSKFLYIGTERGNIYVVNIEVFQLSGYVINWNKAIELTRKSHPGSVVHLSDCPVDPNKLLIGYESGQIVIWDLRTKAADCRYQSAEPLRSVSWHHEGKQFMVSHTDGSLTTWNVKQTCPKPVSIVFPHAKIIKDGKQETCKTIQKVDWTCSKNGDSFVIFSGGLTNDRAGRTPSITVIHGKNTTVLEMEHSVVDFITMCETPWRYDFAEPYALVVLLQNDLVVVDLHSKGYPVFENPYSMDFHESPVTCCSYIADCPADLIPALYSIGARSQKRAGFSEKEWPISGGKWGSSCSYSELVITGHADGSLKFWDASSVSIQILYKLKTAKIFEKPRTKSIDGDEDPLAIHHIALCPESRLLCIAGATSHIICFKYSKQETSGEIQCLEIPIVYEVYESGDISPDNDFPPHPTLQVVNNQQGRKGNNSDNNPRKSGASVDYFVPIHVRAGIQKKSPGYQAELVCLTPWVNGEPPGTVSALSINSSYGLLAYGNESGLVIVDYIQKVCLLSMGTPELYGAADPYQRAPKSPKKPESKDKEEERSKSPASDQNGEDVISKTEENLFPMVGPQKPKAQIIRTPSKGPDDVTKSFENKKDFMGFLNRKDTRSRNPSKEECKKDVKQKEESWVDLTRELESQETFLTCSSSTSPDVAPSSSNDTEVEDSLPTSPYLDSDPSMYKPPLHETRSKSECTDSRKNRFRFKDHLTKLDAKVRRALSLEQGPLTGSITPSAEFFVNKDSSYICSPKLSDPSPVKDRSTNIPNETLPIPMVRCSPSVSPGASPKSLTRSPRGSPRMSTDVCFDEAEEALDTLSPETPKKSLELFDKDGNPIPPLRRKLGSAAFSETKYEEDLELSWNSKQASSSVSSDMSPHPESTPSVEEAPTANQPNVTSPSNKGAFRMILNQLSKMGSSHALGDKLEGSTFSRSRSSSISSLENITSEAIQCLAFADSYTKKNENQLCPTLWVGTSLGSVIQVVVFLPPSADSRTTSPVNVAPSGTIFRLKGSILAMSFLDCNGALIPYTFESWRDAHKENRKLERTPTKSQVNCKMSPTNSGEQTWGDRQFVVIASDKVARVVALPSHNCVYKQIITEVSFVVKAEIIQMKDAVCLVCYIGTGHISIFSLPSLRQLIYTDFLPLADLRIARTFCFTNYGHGLYLCSPTEIQKFTVSADFCKDMQDLLGNLFVPCETPEPPKQSFFKGFFGGGVSQLDREELFGESSGKASRSVAKHIPGPNMQLQEVSGRSQSVAGEVNKTRMMLAERGEKLGQVEDKSAKMMAESENLSSTAHQVMLKYKDKKWYQL